MKVKILPFLLNLIKMFERPIKTASKNMPRLDVLLGKYVVTIAVCLLAAMSESFAQVLMNRSLASVLGMSLSKNNEEMSDTTRSLAFLLFRKGSNFSRIKEES